MYETFYFDLNELSFEAILYTPENFEPLCFINFDGRDTCYAFELN